MVLTGEEVNPVIILRNGTGVRCVNVNGEDVG